MKSLSNAMLAAELGGSWNEKLLNAQRRKLFEAFLLFRQGSADDSVLDVGLRSEAGPLHAFAEAPAKSLMTSCALDAAAAAPHLPWADNSHDWVLCSETIEHTPAEQQQALVDECFRVARKGVFIVTPNRRHPLEFNSGLPLLHWLPDTLRRRVQSILPQARKIPPSLLEAPQLYDFAAALPGAPQHDVGHKRVGGIKAHFFLMIRKDV